MVKEDSTVRETFKPWHRREESSPCTDLGKYSGRGSRQCEAPDGGMGVCPEQMNEREKGEGEAERHGMGEAQNPIGLMAHLAFALSAPRSHCRVLTRGRMGSASCFKSTFPAALRRTYCKGGPKQETGQRGFSTI